MIICANYFCCINTEQEKRSHILSLVEKWRGSGQTQQEFCSFHGIKIHTLSYWIGVIKEDKSSSGFIEALPTNNTIQKIEVIYPNGVKINARVDMALVSIFIKYVFLGIIAPILSP